MKKEDLERETLDLVLKGEWFDMIKSGVKKQEYREIKAHWVTRLMGKKAVELFYRLPEETIENGLELYRTLKGAMGGVTKTYRTVTFRRGYTSNCISFEINGPIVIGRGKPEWGAPKDKDVFIIPIGNPVDKKD